MGKSINTDIWKTHLYNYWRQHGGEEKIKALDSIDWDVSISNSEYNGRTFLPFPRRHRLGSMERASSFLLIWNMISLSLRRRTI